MVKQDKIEVQLVDAATKLPFKEHQSRNNGLTYVEVEPDADYFIRIDTRGLSRPMLAQIHVDGKRLQNSVRVFEEEKITGLLKTFISDGNLQTVTKSFKFMRRTYQEPSNSSPLSLPWSRSVRVTIYEEKSRRFVLEPITWNEDWTDSVDEARGASLTPSKKLVASAEGGHSCDQYTQHGYYNSTFGPKITSFNLHYGTVPELIHLGVLPAWNGRRVLPPHEVKHQAEVPYTQPKKIKLASPNPSIPGTEYELFDLTSLPD